MNYLAHLYFAKPTADSHFGNLLADFGGLRQVSNVSHDVKLGVENHMLVDKFTDQHAIQRTAKALFSNQRRRFAGIILDVLYDHFLIKNWQQFHSDAFTQFKLQSYTLLGENQHLMPKRMAYVIYHMRKNDWFESYRTIEGVGTALDNIAKRLRFENNFVGSEAEIRAHYQQLENLFMTFFPALINHVKHHNIENNNERALTTRYKHNV